MHRASLRVIIPVPEVGDANKSEGGAIVSVWIHTDGWSNRPGGAGDAPWRGEVVSVAAFWSGALAPGDELRSRRLPVSRRLSSRPRTLFSGGRNPLSEDAARKLIRDGLSA